MRLSNVGRVCRALGATAVVLLVMLYLPAVLKADAAAPAVKPVPPELVAALKSLKISDSDGRQKIFDLLAAKGDARLIPALKAYKDGSLLLRDDRLMTYGERVSVPDQGNVIPLIDAVTAQQIDGPAGKPIYFPKPDLSDAIRAPRPGEKRVVNDLIQTLSLLDPDPTVRIASIRETAEHAARSLPDPADSSRFIDAIKACEATLMTHQSAVTPAQAPLLSQARGAIDAALADTSHSILTPTPDSSAVGAVKSAVKKAQAAMGDGADPAVVQALTDGVNAASTYQDRIDAHQKVADELPKTLAALKRQFEQASTGTFAPALKESIASIELVTSTDEKTQIGSAEALGKLGTSRAANLLQKVADAAARIKDQPLHDAADKAFHAADFYQTEVHFIQNTFAGLSLGSILVLMALGLSIIFGLMGVINMAQGEFMMVGAFTTFVVAQFFQQHLGPGAYSYYLIAAIPMAFIVSAGIGFLTEMLVIRHLYGRPLETLLATWGIGLVLVWAVRRIFGDNVSLKPPRWMEGGWEIAPDVVFPLNRVYIICFCAICIAVVYFVVNGTKLGLLLRATTQNREMANALGVPTRRIDGLTFAFGAGLAGLAGVAVPLYDKIKPEMGQDYIVDCFMVVVVGGVGKVAGAIFAGLGLGFIGKYLEPILGSIPSIASGASVIGKVLVLLCIIVFLQRRPQGLFPPKGRNADA